MKETSPFEASVTLSGQIFRREVHMRQYFVSGRARIVFEQTTEPLLRTNAFRLLGVVAVLGDVIDIEGVVGPNDQWHPCCLKSAASVSVTC